MTTEVLPEEVVAALPASGVPPLPTLKEVCRRKTRTYGVVVAHVESSPPGVLVKFGSGTVGFAPLHRFYAASEKALVRWRKTLAVGARVACRTLRVLKERTSAEAAAVDVAIEGVYPELRSWQELPPSPADEEAQELRFGCVVLAIVDARARCDRAPGVRVLLPTLHRFRSGRKLVTAGRVCATEVREAAAWRAWPAMAPQHGDIVRAVAFGMENGTLELSLRPERVREAKSGAVAQALADDALPTEGDLVHGFVTGQKKGVGCFVRVDRRTNGIVMFRDLADDFVSDIAREFPVGKLVCGRVETIEKEDGFAKRLQLNLRASRVVGEGGLTFDDVQPGMEVSGTVANVEDFGVFVRIDNASGKLSGLAHVSEVSDEFIQDGTLRKMFQPGDAVRARVLRVNAEKKHISLSLKPSNFAGDAGGSWTAPADRPEQRSEEEMEAGAMMEVVDDDDDSGDDGLDVEGLLAEARAGEAGDGADDVEEEAASDSEDSDADENLEGSGSSDDEDSSDEEDEEEEEEEDSRSASKMRGGFAWDDFSSDKVAAGASAGDSEGDSDDDSGEEGDEGEPSSRSRRAREKARLSKLEEESLRRREAELLDGSAAPETPEDMERLVLARPNSSFLWIQYVALKLKALDVEGGRRVAQRALRTIHFREEAEKENVWKAWLNLEANFGGAEELRDVFGRAQSNSDPKRMHLALVEVLQRKERDDEAQEALKRARKKFPGDAEVWRAEVGWHLARRGADAAADACQRALQSLHRTEHVAMVLWLAQALGRSGDATRAREAFEGLVSSHPKRSDVWFQYVDREVAAGAVGEARRLFVRMSSRKWKARVAKQLFERWLEFELAHGDDASAERVKDAARRYVDGA